MTLRHLEGIEGKNGHKIDQALTFGITYGFGPAPPPSSPRKLDIEVD